MFNLDSCFARISVVSGMLLGILAATPSHAQEKVLNLYSARHYETDEALYANFTRQTGITINRIDAGEDALLERVRSEGARSPADVFLTVDAGRLWRAEQLGLFSPVKSAELDRRIPASFRHPDGLWFGFSLRARVIGYDKSKIRPDEIRTYADLADPRWKGKICVRTGSHIYNLSLVGAMIGNLGEAGAEQWVRGLVDNFARPPRGGDADQFKAVAAGECQIALANTYYYARLARSTKADERAVADKVGIVIPDQAGGRGAHVNISGAGVLKTAPHHDNAVRFLEYLARDEAQRYFADGNNEWPAVPTVKVNNPALNAFGNVVHDVQNVAVLGRNQPAAQRLVDRAGWK